MSAHEQWPTPTMVRVADGVDGPIDLAVHEMGEGPAVVLVHGFPELAYSWRHQLPAVADAGFRVVAPDMRGYGSSSRPDRIEAYDAETLCGDLVGLLDALDIDRAVFVGHDWGGFLVWAMPLLHPERCAGVVGVCTPNVAFPSPGMLQELFGGDPEAVYISWFQEPGVAEASMDPRAADLLTRLMRKGISPQDVAERMGDGPPSMNPFLGGEDRPMAGEPLCSPEELAVYVDAFTRTGFRGGINWYRNIDRNGARIPGQGVTPIDLPTLQLCAEWDFALRPEMADGQEQHLPDYERHDIAEAGHWVMQDQPEAVNTHLVDWLTRRFGS